MRRILGRYIFEVYPDRTLSEMISRLAEIEAMDDAKVSLDEFCDLELELEALEDAIECLIASCSNHTRH